MFWEQVRSDGLQAARFITIIIIMWDRRREGVDCLTCALLSPFFFFFGSFCSGGVGEEGGAHEQVVMI